MSRIITYFLTIAIIIAIPVGLYRHYRLQSIRTVTITVQTLPDRSIQYDAAGNKNKYANLVYTDKGTFENTDSWFPLKRDSSDLYGKLHEGNTYTCEVVGWRVPVANKYPDLIRCERA